MKNSSRETGCRLIMGILGLNDMEANMETQNNKPTATPPVELELMDYKAMEEASIESIRTGKKMQIAATTTLEHCEKMIKAMGQETERERIVRIK